MDYLNIINDRYPVRKSKEEKEEFRAYIKEEVRKYNKEVEIEVLDDKHHNIIIGDINKAKIIFTAHYDTPATSIVPNIMMPRNLFLGYLYHLGIPILMALFSLLLAYIIKYLFSLNNVIFVILYLILYFGIFLLGTRTFTNKHNKNDNTSGVSLVMTMISKIDNNDIAFILFDNEEKGLLGSKAFNKKHQDIINNILVINLDCIGDGDNIIVVSKDDAIKHSLYEKLKETLIPNSNFKVEYYPIKGSMANSDYKNFKCGIGIMTCHKKKIIGYYTSRIHTNKDIIANNTNIEYISKCLIKLTEVI